LKQELMMKVQSRKNSRLQRHKRIRKRISGTAACPRLAIMVSNRSMYAQLIDDTVGRTLASANSLKEGNPTVAGAQALGERLGVVAKEAGITSFVTDRGGFRFHGRVKAIVDGVLASGLSNVKEAN
jgi:large subunit ribosomal protein L18